MPVEKCGNPFCQNERHRWSGEEPPHEWDEWPGQFCMPCRLRLVESDVLANDDPASIEAREEDE